MLNLILYVVAFIGGLFAIIFVYRKMDKDDNAIAKRFEGKMPDAFRRQLWMGGIIRQAIFALTSIAVGGATAYVNYTLGEAGSDRFSMDTYYAAGGLLILGLFWLVLIVRKYIKEEGKWEKKPIK